MVAHQHPIRRIQDILERLITDEMPEDLHQKGTIFFLRLQICFSLSAQWAVKIAMRAFKSCPAIRKRGTVGQIGPYLSKKLQFQPNITILQYFLFQNKQFPIFFKPGT